MGLYANEDYFLQLDSHHRFGSDWDRTLLDQFKRAGSGKVIHGVRAVLQEIEFVR